MSSEIKNIPGLDFLSKQAQKVYLTLRGEYYGDPIKRREVELSPNWISRDIKNICQLDPEQQVKTRFFYLITMPWDPPVGIWTSLIAVEAFNVFLSKDIPDYISGVITSYSNGSRLIRLEGGVDTGSAHLKQARAWFIKMDLLVH